LFNVRGDTAGAKTAFDRALAADPTDGRVLYERDQLWKRTGESPKRRLDELLQYPALIHQRDDLSVELATLYNQTDQPAAALELLLHRHFQPWEGGEGLVLAQYVRSRLLLGQRALETSNTASALEHFHGALDAPVNLSEARHLLANQNDIYFWLGAAYEAKGDRSNAKSWWSRAARQHSDFQQMAVRAISDMTYWSGMAQLRLGARKEAIELFEKVFEYSLELERTEPKIDYFATSLPAMLLFEEDLVKRNRIESLFLRGQALYGLERKGEAEVLLREVLHLDNNHMGAQDLIRQNSRIAVGTK
jgi:tetratricopeptide (TPR) repeat protein